MPSAHAKKHAAVTDIQQKFLHHCRATVPIIGGAMYPCSNPELVAAISREGGIGIIQPIALTYAHKYNFAEGLSHIHSLTDAPVGMNVIVEKSSRVYEGIMRKWVDQALEAGIRFFVTSLGNPRWVVEKAHARGGFVYHDVTNEKWARKALTGGVDGLIAVNNRAGGHVGELGLTELYQALSSLGVPIVAAGGIASAAELRQCLDLGYAGAQLGTRFIATTECSALMPYKQGIVDAGEKDIISTEKISGVPVSVIRTPHIERVGTTVSWLSRRLLRHRRTKHLYRTLISLRSLRSLPGVLQKKNQQHRGKQGGYQSYWQAGKSVENIHAIASVRDVMKELCEPLGFSLPSSSPPPSQGSPADRK